MPSILDKDFKWVSPSKSDSDYLKKKFAKIIREQKKAAKLAAAQAQPATVLPLRKTK